MITWAVKTLFPTKENKKISDKKINIDELFQNVEGLNVKSRELYRNLQKAGLRK